MGDSPGWGLGECLINTEKEITCYEMLHRASETSCCEHGNESSGCIKGREFIDQLSNYKLLKNDCAPRIQSVSRKPVFCNRKEVTGEQE